MKLNVCLATDQTALFCNYLHPRSHGPASYNGSRRRARCHASRPRGLGVRGISMPLFLAVLAAKLSTEARRPRPFPFNGISLRYSTSSSRRFRSPRLDPSTCTEPLHSQSATMATAPVIPSLDVTKSQKGFQVGNDGTSSLSCTGRLV